MLPLPCFRSAQVAADDCMPAEDSNRDPRVYLAAERTFLAWIRTSLALMAFGFVVSRFGLFLRVLESSSGQRVSEPSALSLPLGVFLVLLGVIVDIFAAWRHVRYVRAIDQGLPTTGRLSTLAVALAVILAVLGLVMAFYLGTTTRSHQVLPNTLNKEHISMRVDANQCAICGQTRRGRLAASLP
jgi:inner membrane protein YidH